MLNKTWAFALAMALAGAPISSLLAALLLALDPEKAAAHLQGV